jgi:ABC-type transport system substrate-binding protein
MELLPLVAAYLEQVGVKIEIQPMEYGAFLSAMTTKTHAPGYFMNNGHTNPTTTIRKSFSKGRSGTRRSGAMRSSMRASTRCIARATRRSASG